MGTKNQRRRDEEPEPVELSDELAWRVHENAKSWIVQVDVKSAAALAIESAVLGFAVALISTSETLAQLTSLSRWVLGLGLALLLGSVFLSMLVLMPRIKVREAKPGTPRGYLYFGDLRHWDKKVLSATLAQNEVSDDQIADQVIKMSQIAWRKHALLKWSFYLLLGGIFIIGGLNLILVTGMMPDVFGDLAATPCPTGATQCP